MARKKIFDLKDVFDSNSCFNLQFRKDARKDRTNSPTYYRWKAQFIITLPKRKLPYLLKIRRGLKCGRIHIVGDQARFSIQKIDDIEKLAIPYFKENIFTGNKKKDFELWKKAVRIIYANKGVHFSTWKKNEMLHLIHIHESMEKFKDRAGKAKWIEIARTLTKTS